MMTELVKMLTECKSVVFYSKIYSNQSPLRALLEGLAWLNKLEDTKEAFTVLATGLLRFKDPFLSIDKPRPFLLELRSFLV